MPLILILLLAVFQCSITNYLIANPDYYQLGPYSWESDDFRAMSLGDAVAGLDNLDPDMVATLMVEHDYDPVSYTHLDVYKRQRVHWPLSCTGIWIYPS